MQAISFAVEDITVPEQLTNQVGVNGVFLDSETSADDASQPAVRQTGLRRACRTRKNGNWTNEQFSMIVE